MSNHDELAISLRPPSGLAGREFGPLVRSQPMSVRGRRLVRFAFPLLGMGSVSLLFRPGEAIGYLGLAATALGVAWAIPRAQAWWRRGRLRRCRVWDGAGPAPAGVVRVSGRVRAIGEPFTTPGEAGTVVYARTSFAEANPQGGWSIVLREDVRGLFLEVDLSPGTSVRIAPEAIYLVDPDRVVPELGSEVRWKLGAAWAGRWRGRLRRTILRPGDTVEAVGEVIRKVSPEGAAGLARGVPMVNWLTPAWPGGVWLRKLEGA